MDTSALVGQQIEDGQKVIHQLTCDRFDIAAAFCVARSARLARRVTSDSGFLDHHELRLVRKEGSLAG